MLGHIFRKRPRNTTCDFARSAFEVRCVLASLSSRQVSAVCVQKAASEPASSELRLDAQTGVHNLKLARNSSRRVNLA